MESFLQHISSNLERGLSLTQYELFRQELIDKINHLLVNDFASLVQILYRIDIDENKLKERLKQQNSEPAATVIADMMLKRVANTIETKKHFSNLSSNELDEDLKW